MITEQQKQIARNIVMEFPDYDDLSLTGLDLPASLVGSSWHNDTCPSVVTSDGKYKIFIDYKSVGKRENEDLPRFSLYQYVTDTDDYQMLIASDNWQDIVNGMV